MSSPSKAYVFSIGEPTTDLCVWSLERQGFDVTVYRDGTSLAQKLQRLYNEASEDFIRVDADVVVNKNLYQLPENREVWWLQFRTFDWFQQNLTHGGVSLIRKEALPALRANASEAHKYERPETYLYRLPEFHDPRRCETVDKVVGLHGYKQDDIQRIKDTKARRNQLDNYDFELAERLEAL